jgi:hypothetical protein
VDVGSAPLLLLLLLHAPLLQSNVHLLLALLELLDDLVVRADATLDPGMLGNLNNGGSLARHKG